MTSLPLWRSMLFVPATADRLVAKAHTRGADALIVDLEDAVAPSQKPRAREVLSDVVDHVGQDGAEVLVRINRPLRLAIPDLEAAVIPGVTALMLPKAENAAHVRLLSEVISELESERSIPDGRTQLITLIETPEGLRNAPEIAACPRVVGITLGTEDFADALGMPEPDSEELIPYMKTLQLAAREAGVLALGYPGSIANFTDLELFRSDVRRARAQGFDGGSCIHPAQVPILNEEFAPSSDEIAKAERIVTAYDEALASGTGAIELDGKMIDVPVANRARRLLARHRLISQREA